LTLSVITKMTEQFMILKPCSSQQADAKTMLRSTFTTDCKIVIIISSICLTWRSILSLALIAPGLYLLKSESLKTIVLILIYAALSIAIISLLVTAIVYSSKLCGLHNVFHQVMDDKTIEKMISLESSRKMALALCILATCIEFFILDMTIAYALLTVEGDMTGAGLAFIYFGVIIITKIAIGICLLSMTMPKYFHSKEVMLAIEYLLSESELARPLTH